MHMKQADLPAHKLKFIIFVGTTFTVSKADLLAIPIHT